jgi:uncharacterized protein (TIGR03083 family)
MKNPQPIIVTHLFPEILESLLNLLAGLPAEDWDRPTACPGWSVKDVALHLWGDDIGILSRKRDDVSSSGEFRDWEELVTMIDQWNQMWVEATRRTSPSLLCDLLRFTGDQACDFFRSLAPHAVGGPVSWAGPEPAPVWLDLAREYTERWHHQQHIREAVGRVGLRGERYLGPVLDAFVRALPHTYRDTYAGEGTMVNLVVEGEAGNQWSLVRGGDRWNLYLEVDRKPDTEVVMDQDTAWRLFTSGLDEHQALSRVRITGDQTLGLKMLEVTSIIA